MPSSPVLRSAGAPSAEQIARTYGPLVSSVCRRMLRDPEAAREAAQEAWVQILSSPTRPRERPCASSREGQEKEAEPAEQEAEELKEATVF
jgi:hypothetical protein